MSLNVNIFIIITNFYCILIVIILTGQIHGTKEWFYFVFNVHLQPSDIAYVMTMAVISVASQTQILSSVCLFSMIRGHFPHFLPNGEYDFKFCQ